MSLNDPISNCLTIIRNGTQANKETVDIPASVMVGRILEIFKNDGYVEDFRLMKDTTQGKYKVYLKYESKKPAIIGLKRISKPGLRVYKNNQSLPPFLAASANAFTRP